jgi:UDP-N-acetylmuramoyl-tripeptide--D-alanyl-D-alanine ligase
MDRHYSRTRRLVFPLQSPSALPQAKMAASGATILDDTYNANPTSMMAALDVLHEMTDHRYALLGDMLELGSAETDGHRSVGEHAARVVDPLFTVGPRGVQIAAAARAAGGRTVRHFDTKAEAGEALRANLGPGDLLLVKASHGLLWHRLRRSCLRARELHARRETI